MLIVGCGCRGRHLAHALRGDGLEVRGTSRTEEGRAAIESFGAHGVLADPLHLGSMLPALDGVSALVWLLGSASGPRRQVSTLNRERLAAMLDVLVDTPVRGVVYEASGDVDPALLAGGAEVLRRAARTWRIPIALVEAPRADPDAWVEAMADGVRKAISAAGGVN